MSEKPEVLRLVNVFAVEKELRRLHAENERLNAIALQAQNAAIDLTKKNERLRELVRHILGDRITPEAYLLFGKAWVDEAHAALRREDV